MTVKFNVILNITSNNFGSTDGDQTVNDKVMKSSRDIMSKSSFTYRDL